MIDDVFKWLVWLCVAMIGVFCVVFTAGIPIYLAWDLERPCLAVGLVFTLPSAVAFACIFWQCLEEVRS